MYLEMECIGNNNKISNILLITNALPLSKAIEGCEINVILEIY